MILILVGTDRPSSNSSKVATIIQKKYQKLGQTCEVLSLENMPLQQMSGSLYGQTEHALSSFTQKIEACDGLHLVVPEYNGSYPGALKYFIDFWKYPQSFEFRPVAFVGIGGRFGGLRPVEHLQQVFGYRNGFIYPDRVFLSNIWNIVKDGELSDQFADELLGKQVQGFATFVEALKQHKLHANYRS